MRKEVLKLLVCPNCKRKLDFDGEISGSRVKRGTLYCPFCNAKYEILDEMPIFEKQPSPEIEKDIDNVMGDLKSILKKRLGKEKLKGYWEHKKAYKDYFSKEMWNAITKEPDKFAYDVSSTRGIIVDIGTGDGTLIQRVAELIPNETLIIGIDADEGVLRHTQKRLKDINLYDRVSLIVSNAKNLPLINRFANLVISHFGFDNIHNSISTFKEVNRILSDNAFLSFSTVLLDENSESHRLAKKYGYGWTDRDLEETLEDSGFHLKSVEQLISGIWPGPPHDVFPIKDDWFAHILVRAQKK